jgi:fluoroacetyl-CoA thioesterase
MTPEGGVPLGPGLRGTAVLAVTDEHTAQAFQSGNVPVFSTPRLVALMEAAAVKAVVGHLAPGDTSVGVRVEISHLAATPVGESVRAEAELVQVDGRTLRFCVEAWDEHQKIGDGTHDRMVVNYQRFVERVATRR